ncbi:MAG: class I SAM-dependent methyltransferase [bacterium]
MVIPDGKYVSLTQGFRVNVCKIWQQLMGLQGPGDFANLEGGSVEQHQDLRLRFHHCANYAAALTVLTEERRSLRVLELGCGSGALSFAFARVMPSDWTLIATDYSRHLIEFARQNRVQDNLRFRCIDIKNFDEQVLNEVDGVMFLEVIEHLPQVVVRDLLHRLYRGLKSQGVVVISTLDRSPFRRNFSGYYPHRFEYRYETLLSFLSNRKNNPFSDFTILRLLSPKIVRAAVRAEDNGGYLCNRLIGMAKNLSDRHPEVGWYQKRLATFLFRVYGFLPAKRDFDLKGYLDDLQLITNRTADVNNSFSLVAVLRKG